MTAANFLITLRNMHERGVTMGEPAPGSFDVKVADRQLDALDAAATRLAQVCKPVGASRSPCFYVSPRLIFWVVDSASSRGDAQV